LLQISQSKQLIRPNLTTQTTETEQKVKVLHLSLDPNNWCKAHLQIHYDTEIPTSISSPAQADNKPQQNSTIFSKNGASSYQRIQQQINNDFQIHTLFPVSQPPTLQLWAGQNRLVCINIAIRVVVV